MRTRLKHAEKVQNQENQNCPNQSQNILSRLSPQKGEVWGVGVGNTCQSNIIQSC